MKAHKYILIFSVLVVSFVTLVIYGWNGTGLASSENIIKVGDVSLHYGGTGDSSVNLRIINPAADEQNVKTVVLAYTCVIKRSLLNVIIPAFQTYWKNKTGEDVKFITAWSPEGFDTVPTKVYGQPVHVLLQATNCDAVSRGYSPTKWYAVNKDVVASTPWVFIVKKGNPKGIRTYQDLLRPGVDITMMNPLSDAGILNIYSIYGAYVKEIQTVTGKKDEAFATRNLRKIYHNVVADPFRGSFTLQAFRQGLGDVALFAEAGALNFVRKNPDYEMVIPPYTEDIEFKIYKMEKNISSQDQQVIDEFIDFLFTEEVQEALTKDGMRPSNPAVLARHPEFAPLESPFTADYLGDLYEVKRDLAKKWARIYDINHGRNSAGQGPNANDEW